jgi:hypothetical protein
MKNTMSRRRLLASIGGLSASLLTGVMPAWADDDEPSPPATNPTAGTAGGHRIARKGCRGGRRHGGGHRRQVPALWGGSGLQVTLIEQESVHVNIQSISCSTAT